MAAVKTKMSLDREQRGSAAAVGAVMADASPPSRQNRQARAAWLRQLHAWHWISAAVSLTGMLLFAVTGITLNHAASIGARPLVTASDGQLPPAVLARLAGPHAANASLPPEVASAVAKVVPLDPAGYAGDWSDAGEVYVTMPGPGRDAWVSIDRTTGKVAAEVTTRGWVSYLNDLHKGRNTGTAWFWFIDIFAGACIVFTLTGLLLLRLHARRRPLTWPMVGISLAVPLVIAVFLIH